MRTATTTLLIAAATAVSVGLVTADGWPGYVVGAVLSLALWVMLLAGSFARPGGVRVAVRDFALASVVGVVLGGAIFLFSDDNAAFWAPGFIIAGVLFPAASTAVTRAERS